jgi:hypothetical protein
MSLLALFGATAAYISAIRLWFHKLRAGALDALRKAQATQTEKEKADLKAQGKQTEEEKVHHMEERLNRAVWWLRGLAVIDASVVVGAGIVFWLAFHNWFPKSNWVCKRPFDEFALAIQIMWFAFILLILAHLTSAMRAFTLRAEYTPSVGSGESGRWYKRKAVQRYLFFCLVIAVYLFGFV